MCRPVIRRTHVLQRCFRNDRGRTRAVNLGAFRQRTVDVNHTVIHTSRSVQEGEKYRPGDVFPVSANLTKGIRTVHGGAKGVAEIYLTRISRERARHRDCLREPGLRLRERRKWDFCVDAAGSFFCSRGLFTQNDRLPMRPPSYFYPPCIHLVSLSGRKSGGSSSVWSRCREKRSKYGRRDSIESSVVFVHMAMRV